MKKISVLFVCLGNICRSPIAEACFHHRVEKEGLSSFFRIDSAGTSDWHKGESYHHHTNKICEEKKTSTIGKSRPLRAEDLTFFDYIYAMDTKNRRDICSLDKTKDYHHKVFHILEYGNKKHSEGMDVPDPYHGGKNMFEHVYELIDDSCEEILQYITKKHSLKK